MWVFAAFMTKDQDWCASRAGVTVRTVCVSEGVLTFAETNTREF